MWSLAPGAGRKYKLLQTEIVEEAEAGQHEMFLPIIFISEHRNTISRSHYDDTLLYHNLYYCSYHIKRSLRRSVRCKQVLPLFVNLDLIVIYGSK